MIFLSKTNPQLSTKKDENEKNNKNIHIEFLMRKKST